MASRQRYKASQGPFIATSHEPLPLAASAPSGQGSQERHSPRAPRRRTLIGARMHGGDMAEQEVIVRNVSRTGICIATHEKVPAVGACVTIVLACQGHAGRLDLAQELQGRVRWSDGRACGIELFDELDVAELGRSTMRRNAQFIEDHDWRITDGYIDQRGWQQQRDTARFLV